MEGKGGKRSVAAVSTTIVLIAILIIAVIAGVLIYYYIIPRERTIKIGLVAPLDIPVGKDMKRAAEMAVEEINEAGGIYVEDWGGNFNISLVIADTKNDAVEIEAVTAVERAVTAEKVDLLIGGFGSSATLADQKVAIDNKVPYIITGASTHLVTRRGPQGDYGGLPEGDPLRIEDAEGMSYMFHYCTTTYHYSRTVVHFFAEHMKPILDEQYGRSPDTNFSLAVVFRGDAYGRGVWGASKHYIAADNLPITIVAEEEYPKETTDFTVILSGIKDAKPDALYVVDFTGGTSEIYIQGQRDVGLNTVYIAVECCEEPEFYTALEEYGDRQLLESKFASYAGPPYYLDAMDDFCPAYEAKYGTTPGMMGADTYDAFYIAKDAIERAGTVNKEKVRDALEETDMPQMLLMMETGRIEFSNESETYHEIAPVTFIEQLFWNATLGECRPQIVWPETAPVVGPIKQRDFELPPNYEPGGP